MRTKSCMQRELQRIKKGPQFLFHTHIHSHKKKHLFFPIKKEKKTKPTTAQHFWYNRTCQGKNVPWSAVNSVTLQVLKDQINKFYTKHSNWGNEAQTHAHPHWCSEGSDLPPVWVLSSPLTRKALTSICMKSLMPWSCLWMELFCLGDCAWTCFLERYTREISCIIKDWLISFFRVYPSLLRSDDKQKQVCTFSSDIVEHPGEQQKQTTPLGLP